MLSVQGKNGDLYLNRSKIITLPAKQNRGKLYSKAYKNIAYDEKTKTPTKRRPWEMMKYVTS